MGSDNPPSPPLCGNVEPGGTEANWDCTYEKVRFLTPTEIEALGDIPVDDPRNRFSAGALSRAGIHPLRAHGHWCDDDLESLLEAYPALVALFLAAARQGDHVLLSSD